MKIEVEVAIRLENRVWFGRQVQIAHPTDAERVQIAPACRLPPACGAVQGCRGRPRTSGGAASGTRYSGHGTRDTGHGGGVFELRALGFEFDASARPARGRLEPQGGTGGGWRVARCSEGEAQAGGRVSGRTSSANADARKALSMRRLEGWLATRPGVRAGGTRRCRCRAQKTEMRMQGTHRDGERGPRREARAQLERDVSTSVRR